MDLVKRETSVIIAQMSKERPRWLVSLGNIIRKIPDEIINIRPRRTRFVEDKEVTIEKDGKVSVDTLKVELSEGDPDEAAHIIARAFRSGKPVIANFNEKTGKWDVETLK
jgi:hypothetical protein